MDNDKLQLFENKAIRTAWDEEKEEWYFSIVDVVAVLTDSPNPQTYWRVMKKRLKDEGNETVTNCNALKMTAADGKKRLTDVATTEQLLRIIQSIPSPKAEPFKLWLAEVGRERIEETIDPEQAIDRALETYLKKGYTREWINQRLQAIQVRKELTDEWQDRGVKKGVEYAILTDEITRAWSGMTTRQYKKLKGLKKENLRDNMSTTEIILNMLAETSTKDISQASKPETFEENIEVARRGGNVAGVAKQALEAETGNPEQAIDRALETYLKKGYTREWINQRLQAIQVRKELTDEWQDRGVKKGVEYAILTDEITRAWSGMTTRQYKKLKGLKKENLRDNMSTTEIILNMLAETSTKDISQASKPETFEENIEVARRGGNVAGIAKQALEAETGKPVITSQNAAQLNAVVTGMIEGVVDAEKKKDETDE